MADRRQGDRRESNGIQNKKMTISLGTFIFAIVITIMIIVTIIMSQITYITGYNKGYDYGYNMDIILTPKPLSSNAFRYKI